MEEEEYLQTLGRLKTTVTKMGNLDVSTVIYMDTWKKTERSQRKRRKLGNVTNAKKSWTSCKGLQNKKIIEE